MHAVVENECAYKGCDIAYYLLPVLPIKTHLYLLLLTPKTFNYIEHCTINMSDVTAAQYIEHTGSTGQLLRVEIEIQD